MLYDDYVDNGKPCLFLFGLPPSPQIAIKPSSAYLGQLAHPLDTQVALQRHPCSYLAVDALSPGRKFRRRRATTLAMDGSGCGEPLPSACQREHAIRRGVPLTFRRRGRSGRRAWPRACPWPHKWHLHPAGSCPSGSRPSSLRSRKRLRLPEACVGGRPRAWSG